MPRRKPQPPTPTCGSPNPTRNSYSVTALLSSLPTRSQPERVGSESLREYRASLRQHPRSPPLEQS
eukprot:1231615-Rhodomonas_salina.1